MEFKARNWCGKSFDEQLNRKIWQECGAQSKGRSFVPTPLSAECRQSTMNLNLISIFIDYYCKCMCTRSHWGEASTASDKWKVQSQLFSIYNCVAIANSTPALRILRKLQNNAFFMSTFRFNHMVHGRFLACCCCCSCFWHYPHRARAIRTIIVCQSHRHFYREYFCLNSNSKKNTFYHFRAISIRFVRHYWISNKWTHETKNDMILGIGSCVSSRREVVYSNKSADDGVYQFEKRWKIHKKSFSSTWLAVANMENSLKLCHGQLKVYSIYRRHSSYIQRHQAFWCLAERDVHRHFKSDWVVRHVQF